MIWNDGHNIASQFTLDIDDHFPPGADLYIWKGNTETDKILAPYGNRSRPLAYSGQSEIVFLKRPFDPTVEDDMPPIAARVQVPQSYSRALILLVPQGSIHDLNFQAFAFDESLSHFPANSLRLVNLSSRQLAVKVGNQEFTLAGNSEHITRFNPSDRALHLMIARQPSGSHRRQLLSRHLRLFDGLRATAYLYSDPAGSQRLRISLFQEDVARER